MSFFRAQVRQEGFHLPSPQTTSSSSPHTSPPSPPPPHSPFDTNALFMPHNVSFLPDAFRKFPAHHESQNPVDFSDELASIIATSPATHHSSSHERSTQSPIPNASSMNYEDPYRPPTHNIFDISAPAQSSSSHHHSHSSSSSAGFSASFSLHRPPSSLSFSHQHLNDFSTPHFNSTLPALNSSMRYEPHPGPEHQQPFAYDYRSQQRHTPSPINTATTATNTSRSRSRSRDIGPTRSTTTTRSRRNNSLSSVSPPPPHSHHRPHPNAILIPGRSSSTNQNQNQNGNANGPMNNGVPVSPLSLHSLSSNTSGWFMSSHTPSSSHTTTAGAGEYSLPTPDSITHPFAHSHSHSHSGMGISPSEVSSIIGGDIGSMGVGSLGSVGVGSLGSTGIGGMSASLGTSLGGGLSNGNGPLAKETNGDPVTKQALLAHEKRRRRRESHNAVERRRRDNINEKISELATLIPECMLDPSAPLSSNADDAVKKDEDEGASGVTPTLPNSVSPPASNGSANGTPTNTNGSNTAAENSTIKANKGMILRKSVEYIRYLQQLVSVQAERNRELERELAGVRDGDSTSEGKAKPNGKSNGKRKVEKESDEDKMGMRTPESSVGVLTPPKDGDEERDGDISTPDRGQRDDGEREGSAEGGEGDADGMNGMMLHDGVLGLGRDAVGMDGFGDMEGVGQMPYFSHHRYELESMPEDMEVEDEDEDGGFGIDKGFGLGTESEVSIQGKSDVDDEEDELGGLVRGRKRDRERERSRVGKEGEAEDMDV